ncbi:uncharacterized protein N7479_001578 [Penicillium vulpinum]|uniref:DH domain-containing protein n=1 Tax=Penicillium vulpinum TaxID=29845 RepID=A0A1V6RUG7_9EURO|nr:uncharacterized protein N7479_001578 [Penicillium vulpinum]KAJ5971660.1 hypothetical protein N7479_001578 [Penicillium vulpinum]OQE05411.1 hypothetical protein PENVUL_c024G07984 [Penicillium vulpinum]
MAGQDDTEIEKQALLDDESEEKFESSGGVTPTDKSTSRPFKKWMDSFRGRKHESPTVQRRYVEGWSDSSSQGSQTLQSSASDSSQLGTVKTTTASIGSQSLIRSRTTLQSATSQSIQSDARGSGDISRSTSIRHADEAAETRSTRRRHILQELVETESDYVLGLKALIGILTIFSTRREIYENVQEILEMHERFLTQLHTASPMSAPQAQQTGAAELTSRGITKRIGTLDLSSLKGLQQRSLRTRSLKASVNQRLLALAAEPAETLEVAREFERLASIRTPMRLLSFPVYDKFCSNYELLTHDVALLRRSIANWTIYDQGIEALSKSVSSTERRRQEDNKSMTLNDLLIKPIQRLCKYPLVLQDLLRATPVSDCPSSHDGIQQALDSIRVQVTRINLAAGNPINKDRIRKTFLLQDKIDISKSHAIQDIYMDLGPVIMCGVLHVTYQTPATTNGEFMVCALFQRYLLFAKGADEMHRLEAVASVYLDSLKFDSLQNGRGLYSYGCVFSWKLLFQNQGQNYEFILSASSAVEEKQWNTEILKVSATLVETTQPRTWEPGRHSFLALQLLPLDHVQYSVSSVARRSMDSTSIIRKSHVQHVVIKKTHFPRHTEEPVTQAEGEIERPKTPVDRSAVTLTARRMDRIRLERLISDIYTADLLPSPGMVLGRGDLFRRGSIMRRLSLRPGFTRRSSSDSTFHSRTVSTDTRADEEKEEMNKEAPGNSEMGENKEAECNSPETPTTPRRSKAFFFKDSPKNPASSVSSPRSEQRLSQDGSSESAQSPKKWSSPKKVFSSLKSKKLKKTRSQAE